MKPGRRTLRNLLILAALIALWTVVSSRYGHLFTLESARERVSGLADAYRESPATFIAAFGVIYVAVTVLSIPAGAVILTLVAGAVLGLGVGTLVVSFASTLGATLAFLLARYLFRESVKRRFGPRIAKLDEGIRREGTLYLFTLRLIPAVSFVLINVGMGLTAMRTSTFYLVSQAGMLPGTLAYVNAGTQLATLESTRDILSARVLLSFAALAALPWVAKVALGWARARRAYRGYRRPARYDYNLVVIGAGSAGLVASYFAATLRAKVALVERHKMGGDCLNTGCVPSKALIRSAKMLAYAARAREFGFESAKVEFDFARVMERVSRVIAQVEPHDSVERYTKLGVECIAGEARLVSPFEVEVRGPAGMKTLATRSIVIATGSEPAMPRIPGLEQVKHVTSDTVWELRELPRRLLVLGGGPIGSELAQAFRRFGSEVTIVQKPPRILHREDAELAAIVQDRFAREGIRLLLGHEAKSFEKRSGEKRENFFVARCESVSGGGITEVEFDLVLVALGRKARVQGFGLEELGIRTNSMGMIETDEFLATRFPNIHACGDVAGPYLFTHVASHQAGYAALNSLFGGLKRFKADYSVIPWCTFTDPEVARAGLSEEEALARGIPHEVTTYGIDDLDRAIADGEAHGRVKVLTVPGKDRILGVTIVGAHAGDLLAEWVLAMRNGLGLSRIMNAIHVYPTLAEANRYAAGNWKKAHAPEKALQWLGKFHRWRLG